MKKFLLPFICSMIIFNTSFASGENGKTLVNANSKYINMAKTFQGEVIHASLKYEEFDDWIQDLTPYQDVRIKIQDGEYNNIVYVKYQLSYYLGSSIPADELKIGDKVYVNVSFDEKGEITQTYIEYINNERFLLAMLVIYAGAIILIGGTKGIKALVGLIVTILIVFYIMVPLIFNGYPPVLVAVLTSIGTILITFVIISGFSKKTYAAVLGTVGGIIVAGVFSVVFGNFMKLTGACDHTNQLSMIENGSRFDFEGIMIAGIMIGALGACMDVGMSIASSLHELAEKTNGMFVKDLIKSGMNIGKDVMGTMTNTLILAYVGSSLVVILLLKGNGFEAYQIVNNTELVIEEVLRAIAGSFGLVFTIPITTLVSSVLMGKKESDF